VAARYNHVSVLQYLCDAGANVNLQDKVCSCNILLVTGRKMDSSNLTATKYVAVY